MNNNELLKHYKIQLETAGENIHQLNDNIRSISKKIDEQIMNNNIGNELNINLNSCGEYQWNATLLDIEIVRFTELQKIVKSLEQIN